MSRTKMRGLLSPKPRLARIVLSVLLLGAVGVAQVSFAQESQNRARQNATPNVADDQNLRNGGVLLLPVRDNVSMLVGAGGNITVQTGDDGILLVDTGLANMSDKVLEAVRRLSKAPLSYIINTDERIDHTGGNENLGKTGRPLGFAGAGTRLQLATDLDPGLGLFRNPNAFIIAFSTVLQRMSAANGQAVALPEGMWPNDTYSEPQKNIYFNGEAIQIFHQPANTDGNSVVFFRRSDVVSTGDIFDPTEYPIIDLKSGGSIQGVIEGLNRLKLMVVPAAHIEGGTAIIPGHGRLSDAADLAVYQQMVTIVRDRIQNMLKAGMTLEQVKAARPTRDYDPLYGSTKGNWTTDMFVEAVYRNLSSK